ncbi:MAG: hypothetical protein HPY78_02550 [Brevinematales bacterium]|nr:hypothetical protein [Brevinematales bacterium]
MNKAFSLFFLIIPSLLYSTIYIGSDKGFFVYTNKDFLPIWTNGSIWEILSAPSAILLRTSHGLFFFDPTSGEISPKNTGLHTWLIQDLSENGVHYFPDTEPLMDVAIAPDNPSVWATCSKSTVYLSTNAGQSWISLGSPTYRGWLSVAIRATPRLTLWAGHALNGIFRYEGNWKRESRGLFADTLYNEEISSLLVVSSGKWKGIWAVNNFFPHLYSYTNKRWEKVQKLALDDGFVSGLTLSEEGLLLTSDQGIMVFDGIKLKPWEKHHQVATLCQLFREKKQGTVSCLWIDGVVLSDLWAFQPPLLSPRQEKAKNKVAFYLPPSIVSKPSRFKPILSLMEEKKANALVIDLKDDWGNLRFSPKTPLLKQLGHSRPLPLSSFIEEAKKRGWYLIARIVLFQDRVLYSSSNFMLAAWDKNFSKPWQGIKTTGETKKEIQEYWVDAYHRLVWQYNLAIAQEAVALGFDEIQFDYVRFPTDGENLSHLFYLAKAPGMTPESLLYSFFRYMRKNLDVPISMDIYGANGWYRTSLRTYQEIDLLSSFVDTFCPMYYPSHFDQGFMAYEPAEERPYRIYFYGSKRNHWIAKKHSLIRPYVQAFKIGVNYDRKYYNESYVQREISGTWDGGGSGYTFWNMGGDYRILSNLNFYPLTLTSQ